MKITEEYKVALSGFCAYCHGLNDLAERIENGEAVSAYKTEKLLAAMEKAKAALLKSKAVLGYTDGLSFLNDVKFAGFEMKDGKIVGNTDKLLLITRRLFEEPANNYQYEVATYLLSYSLKRDYLTEDEAVVQPVRTKVTKKIRKRRKHLWQRVSEFFAWGAAVPAHTS